MCDLWGTKTSEVEESLLRIEKRNKNFLVQIGNIIGIGLDIEAIRSI